MIRLLSMLLVTILVVPAFAQESTPVDDEAGSIEIESLEEILPDFERQTLLFFKSDCGCNHVDPLQPILEFAKSQTRKRRRPARALTCGTFSGEASWYTARRGAPMANGQGFNPDKDQAAHKTLPFGTVVTINCPNGSKVDVTITDDGPHVAGRIIDLTKRSADRCGFTARGHAPVTIEVKCPRTI